MPQLPDVNRFVHGPRGNAEPGGLRAAENPLRERGGVAEVHARQARRFAEADVVRGREAGQQIGFIFGQQRVQRGDVLPPEGDQHAVVAAFAQHTGKVVHFGDGVRVLHLHERTHAVPAADREEFLQRRHLLVGIAVQPVPAVDLQRADLLEGEVAHPAGPVCGAVHRVVVDHDPAPVNGSGNVAFRAPEARFPGKPEGGEGVFGGDRGIAAVPDHGQPGARVRPPAGGGEGGNAAGYKQ